MDQMSTVGMMKKIVPITRFNKGEANKIFDEVQSTGTKIVMKNNRPACVLVSPEQYESLIEMLSDYLLLAEADTSGEAPKDAMTGTRTAASVAMTSRPNTTDTTRPSVK